jgi:hypothetical protein
MTISRYASRFIFENDFPQYRDSLFRDRGVKKIFQYGTAALDYPDEAALEDMETLTMIWGATDKLYNVAHEAYGDPAYWWVIAWFNKKPTESHFKTGDVIYVPVPLDAALRYF